MFYFEFFFLDAKPFLPNLLCFFSDPICKLWRSLWKYWQASQCLKYWFVIGLNFDVDFHVYKFWFCFQNTDAQAEKKKAAIKRVLSPPSRSHQTKKAKLTVKMPASPSRVSPSKASPPEAAVAKDSPKPKARNIEHTVRTVTTTARSS